LQLTPAALAFGSLWHQQLNADRLRREARTVSQRRYTIKPAPDFHVGRLRDGRQVLLGLLCPEVVAYFFGAEGTLVSVQRQPWRTPAARMINHGPYQIHEPIFEAAIQRQISDWKTELGITDGPISVEAFFDEELFVGVEDVPEHLDEPEDDETPS